jgi:hypothetical protein
MLKMDSHLVVPQRHAYPVLHKVYKRGIFISIIHNGCVYKVGFYFILNIAYFFIKPNKEGGDMLHSVKSQLQDGL